jgi:hypothetical protein
MRFVKWFAAVAFAAASPCLALAQTNPNLTKGQVLTAGQWNALFAGKQDTLGYVPLNLAGGVMTGRLITAAPGASLSGFGLSCGSIPASPADGDLWCTSAGLFTRINGSTVGPLLSVGAFPAFSGDVATSFGSTVTTIQPNAVTNAKSAQMGAATLKGNPTASPANASDFTIQGLTARGAPDATNDKLVILDNATGTLKYVTPGLIASSATSGVSSLGGVTGPVTLGSSLQMTGSALNVADASITNAKLATGAANTVKGSVNGTTTSDLAIASCSALYNFTQWVTGSGWQCGLIPVLPSRAIAATLNLSAFTSVTTQGYALPGDGGEGKFQKISAGTPFLDTYVDNSSSPPTLVGGSGYPNGTYLGVPLGAGSGLGCSGAVTVTLGAVSAVSLAVPCAGYKIGDVLIAPSLPGGAGFTWTITAISTPQASFTDSGGNKFQYVVGQSGVGNILAFGGKGDWNSTDGLATNNSPAIWSAGAWAAVPVAAATAVVNGNQIFFPRGAYMTCGLWNGTIYHIPISQSVRFTGVNYGATTFVQCAADPSASHYVELCDSNSAVGQFGCMIERMTLNLKQVTTGTAGFAAVYSNSGQQFPLTDDLEIQPGLRSCIKYEIGKGGASNDIWGFNCDQSAGATNPALSLNASSTQHIIKPGSAIACAGAGNCQTAILHQNGRLLVDGLDIEAFQTGLVQNVSTANNNSVYRNVQQNSNNCVQAAQLASTNTPGNLLLENVSTGCPLGISNGQSGGTNYSSGVIRGALMCVSGACAPAVP